MANRIPEMSNYINTSEVILKTVGEPVHVGIHVTENGTQSNYEPTEILRDLVRSIMTDIGVGQDHDLEMFGLIVAKAAIGKLAASEGFTARFGNFFDPREIVDVNLRPEPVRFTEVQAERRQ